MQAVSLRDASIRLESFFSHSLSFIVISSLKFDSSEAI
jgi:hypothetical protein